MGLINVLWKGSSVKQDSTNRLVSDSEKSTWNGKANSSHTHITSQITDFGTHVYDATIKRAANTVLAAPNGSAGVASFRKLQITDITNLQSTLDGKASKDDVFVPDFNVPRKTPINLATAGATKNVQNYIGTTSCPHVGDYWLLSTPGTSTGQETTL